MSETIKKAKLSGVAFGLKLCLDLFACAIFIGFVWLVRDVINYKTTELEITNNRIKGKKGLINTSEIDSPLSKINSVQLKQGLFGKMFNYGTLIITTASSVIAFDYISEPSEFKEILNNQIDKC